MIAGIQHRGPLNLECAAPGLPKRECGAPAHPVCAQVSRDRFLLVFGMRAFRGIDDDGFILYQLRADAPDGKILKEGVLKAPRDDWDLAGTGQPFYMGHGSPIVFGVPKGAKVKGETPAHANLFPIIWYRTAKLIQNGRHELLMDHSAQIKVDPTLFRKAFRLEWVHARLNEAEDDIEVVAPVSELRQKGYETSDAVSDHRQGGIVNHAFVPHVPYTEDCREWVTCYHGHGRMTVVRFAWNPGTGLYEWVETGPPLEDSERMLSEASVVRMDDAWVVMLRTNKMHGETGWLRTDSLLGNLPAPTYVSEPKSWCPRAACRYADGVLRIVSGDIEISPYKLKRNPLYIWDVDPEHGFTATNRRVVFDAIASGLPLDPPMIGFGKPCPPQGRRQLLTHRVATHAYLHAHEPEGLAPITDEAIAACGTYYAEITYTEDVPPMWSFA